MSAKPQFDVMMLGTHAGLLTGTEGSVTHSGRGLKHHACNSEHHDYRTFRCSVCKNYGTGRQLNLKDLFVRLHFAPVPDVHQEEDYHFTIGKANVMRNETNAQVTFLVTGNFIRKGT